MKEARAVGNYMRVTPRKARLVVDCIRGRNAAEALTMLTLSRKRAAGPVRKILASALANAEAKEDPGAFVVSRAFVDEGPTLKRYMPRAMGRATMIRKRTSRITIELREHEKTESAPVGKGAKREAEPVKRTAK